MKTGNLFHAFQISATGLSTQRARLNVISSNIANAQTTRTAEGGAYRRRLVIVRGDGPGPGSDLFERLLSASHSLALKVDRTSHEHLTAPPAISFPPRVGELSYEVTVDSETPTRMEHDPGHPDADENGYVEYPNVEVIREMVDLMAASRAYEANVTVMNATKAMLRKALEI